MKKITESFHFYAIITICFWAPTYVFTKILAPYFSPAALGFLRYLIASVILTVILLCRHIQAPDKKDLPLFAAAGLSGFALYMVIFNHGTPMITSATSSIILASSPVMTDLLAVFFFREKLNRVQWAAVGVEFIGILVLTLINSTFSLNIGVLWVLCAAILLSFYNIIQRKLTRTYNSLQAVAYSIFFGTLFLSFSAGTAFSELRQAPGLMIGYVVFLGVFSSALAYVTWSTALAKADKTSEVMNYMFITPFLTTGLGFLLEGEVPNLQTIFGGVIIISGAFLFNYQKRFSHKA